MKTEIFNNYQEFLQRKDKSINGVSKEFSEKHKNYEEDNLSNVGCWDCSYCSYCSYCSNCSDCFGCSRCSGCYDCFGCFRCYDCFRCYYCSESHSQDKAKDMGIKLKLLEQQKQI